MRKLTLLLVSLIVVLLSVIALPLNVFADGDVKFVPSSADVNAVGGCNPDSPAYNSPVCTDLRSDKNPLFGPDGILTKVANIFALITGVISVFMVIIGGQRYITSSGDPTKTSSAKNAIMYAAIGLAVAAVSGSIARFLLSRL